MAGLANLASLRLPHVQSEVTTSAAESSKTFYSLMPYILALAAQLAGGLMVAGLLPAPSVASAALLYASAIVALALALRSSFGPQHIDLTSTRRLITILVLVVGVVLCTRALLENALQTQFVQLATTASFISIAIAEPLKMMTAARYVSRAYIATCVAIYALPGLPRASLFRVADASFEVSPVFRDSALLQVGDDGRLFGFTASPNAAGALLLAAIAVEVGVLLTTFGIQRILAAVSIAGATYLLILTNSQSAYIASLVFVAGLAMGRVARRVINLAALGAAAWPMASATWALTSGSSSLPFAADFATGRGAVWEALAARLRDYWATGVPVRFVLPPTGGDYIQAPHAHNVLLQTWALCGLFATVVFFCALVFIAWRSANTRVGAAFGAFATLSASSVPFIAFPGSFNMIFVALTIPLITIACTRPPNTL